jgi:hypothetical protein
LPDNEQKKKNYQLSILSENSFQILLVNKKFQIEKEIRIEKFAWLFNENELMISEKLDEEALKSDMNINRISLEVEKLIDWLKMFWNSWDMISITIFSFNWDQKEFNWERKSEKEADKTDINDLLTLELIASKCNENEQII